MDFKTAIAHILHFEGGYVNDPKDLGGETKYGISKRSYPHLDIKNLTRQEAEIIYKLHYWDVIKGNELPEKVRLMVFDCAVNQGVLFASRTLQKCTGVTPDGIIGPVTIYAARREDPGTLLYRYFEHRTERYRKTKHFDHFGQGWLNRLKDVAILCGGIEVG